MGYLLWHKKKGTGKTFSYKESGILKMIFMQQGNRTAEGYGSMFLTGFTTSTRTRISVEKHDAALSFKMGIISTVVKAGKQITT
jgi:hypothetical protein